MSLPQMKGSLVTNQLENHIALAGFHIDFSLIKVQPPTEYHDIGQSLSARRKTDADQGQSHLTTAQLGVLFSSIIPDVPDLIRAYGLRCSEIARSPTFNPKGTSRHGIFANEVGADGTAIWAAATSGAAAIAVHLLGCMLSRMWDPPEAISIWMQLIAERKQLLAYSGNLLEMELARKISLSREHIANWHTSIQAWQRTADEANARRQNQLLLILNNLGLAVNTKFSVTDSVVHAWTTAMVTVDKLVSGKPQSVQTGAPLLGLSSWHLYPDMIVFGMGRNSKATKVAQDDPHIVRGGVLTLGIQDLRRSGEGIHWSLPLAFLRYYGQAVHSEAQLSAGTSRVHFESLVYVALGSLIRRWVSHSSDIDPALRLFEFLQQYCARERYLDADVKVEKGAKPGEDWTDLLASASSEFLKASADAKLTKLQLIKCGRRRYPLFIDDPATDCIFGLSAPSTLLRLIPNSAERVKLLRHVALDFGENRTMMVIQSKSDRWLSMHELTTVVQLHTAANTVSSDCPEASMSTVGYYLRWLPRSHQDIEPPDQWSSTATIYLEQNFPPMYRPEGYQWNSPPVQLYSHFLAHNYPKSDWKNARDVTITFSRLFGDPDTAALYSVKIDYWTAFSPNIDPVSVKPPHYRSLPNIFVISHVLWAFQQQLLGFRKLQDHFSNGKAYSKIFKALRALQLASLVYKNLHKATIELRAAEQPLAHHQWIPHDTQTGFAYVDSGSLSMEHTFACIAKFESGNFNFHPSAMNGVLAISSGNSIYVASSLLQDPCNRSSTIAVERVVGNLGKTGMSLLVSPAVPQVRVISEDVHLVNHFPFDGKEENSFAETSLHLSFTEWQLPIDVGSRGNRDVEASYVEAAVGLYDRGKWVADLNILDVFTSTLSVIIPDCKGHRSAHDIPLDDISEFVTIDSWEELLDSPTEVGVVRARGNWQARLAAAALAIQRGHRTRIVPDRTCWLCCWALNKESQSQLKTSGEEDTHMADDAIGHVEWVSDDEESDSETEDVIAALKKKSSRKDDDKATRPGMHDYNGPAVNRNTIYIL